MAACRRRGVVDGVSVFHTRARVAGRRRRGHRTCSLVCSSSGMVTSGHGGAGRRARGPHGCGARRCDLEPSQSAVSAAGLHEAGSGTLLRRGSAGRSAGRWRPSECAGALSERHRRRVLLSEAGAAIATAVGRGCRSAVSIGPQRRRSRPARRSGASCGWPTSPVSSCIRTRCAPTISTILTSCGWISIRCQACTWSQIRDVAGVVRATLDDFGLVGWPKTSGSRGMHVYVRIERRWTFDEVRRAALALAREVERRAPQLATSKWWKEERHGVFLDYNQNAKDRTVASAYSVRPTPDARVSAPLAWDEIEACDPADFTLATMPARFARIGDRHAGMDNHPGSLDALLELSARQAGRGSGRRAVATSLPEAAGRGRRAWRHHAAGRRSIRSSRSGALGKKRTPLQASSAGRHVTRKRARIWSQPTCSLMRCVAAFARGRGFA